MTHLPQLVVLLTAALVFATIVLTGRARMKYNIKAPAVSGHPGFERAYRVQMNTLEQTVLFLPVLWLAAAYANPAWAGILGLVWLAGRIWYIFAYQANPVRRGPPFGLAMLAWLFLFVLAAWGVMQLLLSPA